MKKPPGLFFGVMRYLAVLLFCLEAFTAQGQEPLQGRVFDSTNDRPLSGASVVVGKEGTGVATDERGVFQLEGTWTEADSVYITYVGYRSESFKVEPGKFLQVGMQMIGSQLDEVVVAAYQADRKLKSIPGAVAVIPRKEIDRETRF